MRRNVSEVMLPYDSWCKDVALVHGVDIICTKVKNSL